MVTRQCDQIVLYSCLIPNVDVSSLGLISLLTLSLSLIWMTSNLRVLDKTGIYEFMSEVNSCINYWQKIIQPQLTQV